MLHSICQASPTHLLKIATFPRLQSLELSSVGPLETILHQAAFWTGLTCIQTLVLQDIGAVPHVLSTLPSLSSLSVSVADWSQSNISFEDLTRLTEICVELLTGPAMLPPLRGLLPVGSNVQLRKLTLKNDAWCRNLPYATLLTRLDPLMRTCGVDTDWPIALPNLQIINVPKLDEDSEDCNDAVVAGSLPDQWQHYRSLQRITLRNWQVNGLPDWLPALKALRVLELFDADYGTVVSELLLQLPLLEVVDVGVVEAASLPKLVDLAQLPNLKQLTFVYEDEAGEDDQEQAEIWFENNINLLQDALDAHPLGPFEFAEVDDEHSVNCRCRFTVANFAMYSLP